MKKLLLLTLEYPPKRGGVAEYLRGLYEALPADKRALLVADVPARPLAWLPWIAKTRDAVRRERAEALAISHVLPMGYVALLLKWFTGLPYVVFTHGTDLKMAKKTSRKTAWTSRILRNASLVIANSEYTRSLALGFGVPAERTEIIYPCPAAVHDAAGDREAARETLKLSGKKILLSVARLVRRKGHEKVIGVLPALREKFGDVVYLIVGLGPEETRLRELAAKNGVSNAVIFCGDVSPESLPTYYQAADAFVLPGSELPDDVEGFGLAYLEAAAHGLPSVAGRGGGAPEAVLNGETGWLVNPESDRELYEAISRLFSSPEEAKRLGDAGRKRVAAEFVWSRQAGKLQKHLETAGL